MIREIIVIDEERCDGCGECVPSCAEGAIQIVEGKARLMSDGLCDGLGACLGHCPQGALRVERREAAAFDEAAVAAHLSGSGAAESVASPVDQAGAGGHACPSMRFDRMAEAGAGQCPGSAHEPSPGGQEPSELAQWPVQLRLLPAAAPMLRGARLLLSADCIPFALPDFHRRMLRGRALAIACPKLDETESYLDKLTEMIRVNDLAEITVAHMEVPCCTGLIMLALEARRRSGKDLPITGVVVSTRGQVIAEQEYPDEAA